MDFKFDSETENFRREVHEFLQKEVTDELRAEMHEWSGESNLARSFIRKMGDKGWVLPVAPKEYGGLGAPNLWQYIVVDEASYALKTWGFSSAIVFGPLILQVGSEEQKKNYLTRLARGEIDFSAGYTEPEAGSDLTNISCRAEEKDDHYLVNGQKIYTSNGLGADYQMLCARTEDTNPKYMGLSMFIVPMDIPGLTIQPMEVVGDTKLGVEYYDNVRLPKENLVGQKNNGFLELLAALDIERIYPFPAGQAKRILEDLVEYAKETRRGGKTLDQDPLIRQRLAELAIEVEVVQGLIYRAMWSMDQGKSVGYEASISKVFITELDQRLLSTAVRLMGPYGQLTHDSKYTPFKGLLERRFLISLYETFGAGSSEIQRNMIAQRGLGLPRK